MITGNKTQNIKEIIDNVNSYIDETKNKNDNIIKQLKMIEKFDQSSVNKILKDKKIAIDSIESQYKNILKMLNDIETNVNDLVSRIKLQEEVDKQIYIEGKPADNKKIFKVLKDFTKNNIVGSTANNDKSKMQPIQALTNAVTKYVKIESQDDLSDLRDILISVIEYLDDVKDITLYSNGGYNNFVLAVYDKVKPYIFKDIKENDSIDKLVDGFSKNIQLFNTIIISPIIDTIPKSKTSIVMLGTICNFVFNEFYNRLLKHEWNYKSFGNYKRLTEKHLYKLNAIPEQIRNYINGFGNDFCVELLLKNIENKSLVKKRPEEVLRKKDIRKEKLPDILQHKKIKLNTRNNLNINNVNLDFNNNDNLQFQNQYQKKYFELLEQERKKELYKNAQSGKGTSSKEKNKKKSKYPPINNISKYNRKNNNINNNQSRKGTRNALNKFELPKNG